MANCAADIAHRVLRAGSDVIGGKPGGLSLSSAVIARRYSPAD
jgi:hypothetical protein